MAAQEWIEQIAAGDREAFRAVYEKYGKTVYQRALAQTGDKEQAQAVLKNVFRTLFRQLRDSDSDPLLFLLEGLTDLETGASSGEAPAKTEEAAPKKEEPVSAPAPAPAEQPETDVSTEAPAAEPVAQPAQPQEDDTVSMFDRAERELRSEYEATPLTTDQLNHLADAPANADEEEADEEEPRKSHRGLTAFLIVLLVLLVLITLWFGAGVLMMYSIIPKFDLGYSWFNENLFNLFRF